MDTPSQKTKATHVVLVKTEAGIHLMLDRDRSVAGFSSETEAIRYFERGYLSAHSRSYEGSMSACLNWMTFQYSVIPFSSLQWLVDTIVSEDKSVVSMGNVAGSVLAVTTRPGAEAYWGRGTKPNLLPGSSKSRQVALPSMA